jgi:tetratricopeptide (TPR) repeat protein
MAEEEKRQNIDSEFDFGDDKVVTLKEGELSEDELAEKKKRNSQLSTINIAVPDPKALLKEHKEKIKQQVEKHKDSLKTYGLAIISLLTLLFIMIMIFAVGGDEESEDSWMKKGDEFELYTDIAFKKSEVHHEERTQVEELVQKANLLYQRGDQKEALQLYGRIATYNASLSYYNLGVSRMKKGQCEEAIDAFDRAIQNREHITPSAINAGVCSKELNRTSETEAYFDLAYKHLPDELDSSLYSYYYSLIAYYRGEYFETFSSLKHRTSEHFTDEKNMMESRVNLLYENYGGGASALEKSLEEKDRASLGLIYANMGELELAKSNLEKAIERTAVGDELIKNLYALSLINLKRGDVGVAGNSIHSLYKEYGDDNISKHYNLELFLKEDLFDVQKAQKYFQKELQFSKYPAYQILLYFAPYKIFDAKKSINAIRKGSSNIAVGDSEEALHYLQDGAKSSDVNKNIVLAIKEILNKRLRTANKILKEIEKDNPKHAILHYDLGLTYAQLGDMSKASSHFVKSFHLDSRDYISGVFALMTGELAGEDLSKLGEVLNENLTYEDQTPEKRFIQALLQFKKGSTAGLKDWLDSPDNQIKSNIFHMGLAYLSTLSTGDIEANRLIAKRIFSKLPEDILANMLYMYSSFKDLDIKEFSKKVIRHFQTHQLPLYSFYYGSRITQEMFIKFHLLTGYIKELEKKLEHFYRVEIKNPEGIAQALALTKIYSKNFEEAYKLYNKLIDDYGVKDSRTLFLAGLSAVASKHYPNAVALFELAKLKNIMNLETRYALGLLYLQTKNFEAGGVQFKRFGSSPFFSDFFDFNIDHHSSNL